MGGIDTIKTDVLVIAATHHNMEKAVLDKRFREDLFYRLNVIQINIPALRKRKEDIAPLADFFMRKYQSGARSKVLTPETLNMVHTSKLLGISRGTIRIKMVKLKKSLSFDDGDNEAQERDCPW